MTNLRAQDFHQIPVMLPFFHLCIMKKKKETKIRSQLSALLTVALLNMGPLWDVSWF